MPARKTSSRRKGKNQEVLLRRKEEIIKRAVNLFVAKGFDGTTMEEIADASGISKGSLYTSVGSKENLVYLIQGYTTEDYKKQFSKIESKLHILGPIEALLQLIEIYLRSVDKMQDAYNFLIHVSIRLDKEGRQKLYRAPISVYDDFEKILNTGVKEEVFKISNPKLVAHIIVRLCSSWAHNRWYLRKMMDLKSYIKELTVNIMQLVGADNHDH